MEDAESSERRGGHLDSLLTLTNMPLSGPNAELRGCVHTVCGQTGKSSCRDPCLPALRTLCVTMPTRQAKQDKSGNLTKVR